MTTAVIGAGIIGTALAHALQRRGRDVVLLERDAPGKGASFGNMASIAVTEFMPASRPSVWKQIPGWMLDPEGPVRVRPAYMPKLLPWFLRFVAASRPAKLRELEAQGAALCQRVYDDLLPLLTETGLMGELSEEGCLSLYTDEAEFRADREHIEILERFGFPHEVIGRQAIKALEPELSDRIGLAVLFPQNRSMRNPYQLVVKLAEAFRARGGRIEPLETERGYHTQIMSPGIAMKHSIIWPARAFMVTPTAGGIRVGGTVEMAGIDAPPDYRRSKVTVRRAREALPNLRCEDFTEWMGHRPAFPDTVPVMSASARTKGLFYATGHGHLGLTLAATNARLMADLITGQTPPIDMTAYRVDRF